jgi:hypothetical protein
MTKMTTEDPAPAAPVSVVSQLSDAIARFLFTSFDDVAKNLVERLLENRTSVIPEVEEMKAPAPSAAEPPPPPPPPPPAPTFVVPLTRNPEFGGRAGSLDQLFGMWKPCQKRRIAVVGLGGIG